MSDSSTVTTTPATTVSEIPLEHSPTYNTPAYGFGTDRAAADAYLASMDKYYRERTGGIVVDARGKCYVSRPWIHQDSLRQPNGRHHRMGDVMLSQILGRYAITSGQEGTAWTHIRKVDNPKPDGAYNVILVNAGPRSFNKLASHRAKAQEINSGPRDFYARWTRLDTMELTPPVKSCGIHQHIHAVQSARGVLYAQPWTYDPWNGMLGPEHKAVLVKFQLYDRDHRQDDAVKLEVITIHLHRLVPQTWGEENRIDERWQPLINEAVMSYNRHCQPMSDETRATIERSERERMARKARRSGRGY